MTPTPEKPRYIIKPLAITQDNRLSYAEQDYLCLIWQLHNAQGCTAGNKYFASYFNVARPRVSEVITSLKNKGIIQTIEAREGKNITGRTIIIIDEAVKESLSGGSKESLSGGSKKSPVGGSKKSPEEKIDSEIKYNTTTKKLINITPEDVSLWEKAYPGINIELQLRRMEVWLDANPDRRPKRDYKRFITGWLSRTIPSKDSGELQQTRELTEDEADALFKEAGIV